MLQPKKLFSINSDSQESAHATIKNSEIEHSKETQNQTMILKTKSPVFVLPMRQKSPSTLTATSESAHTKSTLFSHYSNSQKDFKKIDLNPKMQCGNIERGKANLSESLVRSI